MRFYFGSNFRKWRYFFSWSIEIICSFFATDWRNLRCFSKLIKEIHCFIPWAVDKICDFFNFWAIFSEIDTRNSQCFPKLIYEIGGFLPRAIDKVYVYFSWAIHKIRAFYRDLFTKFGKIGEIHEFCNGLKNWFCRIWKKVINSRDSANL